ncbi:MAG: hypothetical protein A2X49_15450 [Lentisphaerae bacterium GWF2_52_8]|nr:MAG: hypothetical protein A2X49_15450 [Lentisphaerae bacterium GWF2_52_8]
MKSPKIVMVGGGSYNWSPRLICDLIHTPELEGAEIVLLDLNLKPAQKVKDAAVKMAETLKRRFKFTVTRNEDLAFSKADFVIVTISTGGFKTMRHDLEIPERYGIYHTVGDSVGPGGWSRALRNIPVFAAMARKIERLSPNAILLNYTNPMASLTGAVAAASSLRSVGLCHGVFGTYKMLEQIFGVTEKELSVRFGGINHFFWLLDFKVKGQEGYPLLRKKLKGKSLDGLMGSDKDSAGFEHTNHMFCDELLKEYGYLTYAGDRHTCEFFTAYLTNIELMKKFKLVRTSIVDREKMFTEARQRVLDLASGKMKPFEKSRETAIDIIRSFATNEPFVDVVNLPNQGQIDNLPRGAVVETLGLVNARGFSPIATGPLPERLRALLEPHCIVQKMTLEAALSGDKEIALQALMLDPLCARISPSKIREMGLSLMEATKAWLPQFK